MDSSIAVLCSYQDLRLIYTNLQNNLEAKNILNKVVMAMQHLRPDLCEHGAYIRSKNKNLPHCQCCKQIQDPDEVYYDRQCERCFYPEHYNPDGTKKCLL